MTFHEIFHPLGIGTELDDKNQKRFHHIIPKHGGARDHA